MSENLKTGWKFIVNSGGMISKLPYEEALNSDQAEIKSTLGREMIQNSIDACVYLNHPVKMSFRWINFENDTFLSPYVNELIPKLKKMDKVFDKKKVDINNPSFLVIEDFNTTGLTGKFDPSPDEIEKDIPNNYFGYFHKLGYSGKSQVDSTTGGRRGIGRSVGAIVSSLNSMFVVSKRKDDDVTFLKGLCLGEKFVYDEKVYDGYGYFCNYSEDTTISDPITDIDYIETISEKLQIHRNNEYGTSTIIPFPDTDLVDYDQVTLQILKNYYVVIGDGKLEIEISYTEGSDEDKKYSFNKDNILDKLNEYNLKEEYDFLKDFIVPCFGKLKNHDFELKSEAHADGKIDKKDFTDEEIRELRDKFNRKELINLKANISLKPKYKKNEETKPNYKEDTYINFFFQKTDSDRNSKAYYQRGLMPLMGEGKDFSANSYGFMYANDAPAVAFIAASEGTNHLTINTSEAELRKNYRPPYNLQAKFIKKGLYQIMDLILLIDNEEDTNFEKDYFTILDIDGENEEVKNITDDDEVKDDNEIEEVPTFRPIGEIPSGDGKPFKVTRLTSERGYKIKINKSFKNINSMFPFKINFKCAYSEFGKRKSFNNHEDLDFDLKTDSPIKIECRDVDILERNTQSVNFEIKNIESEIKITNFYEKFEVDVEIEQI